VSTVSVSKAGDNALPGDAAFPGDELWFALERSAPRPSAAMFTDMKRSPYDMRIVQFEVGP
jgi:hypothetical protein